MSEGPPDPQGSLTPQGLQAPYQHHNLKCQELETHHTTVAAAAAQKIHGDNLCSLHTYI